ncbi:helix-turn-helix domain-containing protein [bacterium]|nr:helix-turn-helix domain-containing protein [bacterium]
MRAVAGGQPRKTAADVLGVHYKTVARWVRAARRPGGVDANPHPLQHPA